MLIPLTVVPNDAEAELLCALLRTEGIECDQRATNFGAGAMEGMRGGPREVFVAEESLERAREIVAASTRRAE